LEETRIAIAMMEREATNVESKRKKERKKERKRCLNLLISFYLASSITSQVNGR
jgi:hypothetical protein